LFSEVEMLIRNSNISKIKTKDTTRVGGTE
jgi:hypothetical protein